MRSNQRLQSTDSRLCLKHNTAAPLTGYVQVAHSQRDDDGADRECPNDEGGVRVIDDQ